MEKVAFYFEFSHEILRNLFRFLPGIGPKKYRGQQRLDGKVVVVTGANSGIGKEAAEEMAARGAEVVMACRNLKLANEAADDILSRVPNAHLNIMHLDMSTLGSVRNFATQLSKRYAAIDVLINNAGVMMLPKSFTIDGFETHFGVNYLGHYLLTRLLIDQLKAAPSAKIINVVSVAYAVTKIRFDDIHLDRKYSGFQAYARTKLAGILFTRELAKRLAGTNIRVFSFHPGLIKTNIYRHFNHWSPFESFHYLVLKYANVSTKIGIQTLLYCVLNPQVDSESGSYYNNCKKWHLTSKGKDDETAKKLWDVSSRMVGISQEIC